MSWSASRTGLKDKALAAIDADLAKSQESYETSNPAEAKDIAAARAIITSAVVAVASNGVRIDASGSRYSGYANLKIDIAPVQLEL